VNTYEYAVDIIGKNASGSEMSMTVVLNLNCVQTSVEHKFQCPFYVPALCSMKHSLTAGLLFPSPPVMHSVLAVSSWTSLPYISHASLYMLSCNKHSSHGLASCTAQIHADQNIPLHSVSRTVTVTCFITRNKRRSRWEFSTFW